MAVLFTYEAIGNPTELLKKYKDAAPAFGDPKHRTGLLAHICLETPNGIQVLNLMESEEPMRKLINDPGLGEVVEKVGLSSVDVPFAHHNYKVHDFYVKR